jgi:hypothetical protein
MATTTNYGWTTPDNTDLVKDGALAIRTLGSSVDTTTKALNPSTTLGDIEYRSATANTNTRLGIGTTGQILTVASGVPSWATPAAAGGGFVLIQAPTTFSGVSSQSINSVFTSTYTNYKIVITLTSASAPGNTVSLRMRASGTDTTTNYVGQRIYGTNTTVGASRNVSGTNYWYTGGETSDSSPIEISIFNPQTSTKTQFLGQGWSNSGSTALQLSGGTQTDSTQFDGFTLFSDVGTITGTLSIYGLAK